MTARIVLLSHAPTSALRRAAFPTDEELEPQGVRQVAEAAPLFADLAPRVRCGPSLRCLRTAEGLGLAAEVDDGLRDLDAGRWAGRTLAEVQAEHPEGFVAWLTDPEAAPHGGESVAALIGRVAGWLAARHGDGRVLAVTHPAVVRAAVVHAMAAPPRAFWGVDVPPLGHVTVTSDGRRWHLRLPVAGQVA
ncbi:phosphoglycerate mutase [Sphaerisporangium krabiense]|uniref:Broad specificity phosphatase PhoE n=1 Tax=Sphaerisporangium krabiense TaxID=763782 RepID=A0A7W8Z6M6_9ACTN|nr:histidine phosphatase family protein [Sphaerisporangium krabiense]MBB5628324.1 broad specificity phosphatase PhoE [Sphaerisporangium krabiense]GII66321.1 phosphoglycerate mutase [Sphaerisporangium krabiense]